MTNPFDEDHQVYPNAGPPPEPPPAPITTAARAAFLADLIAVCERHGLSLAHEDSEGGFLVAWLYPDNLEWLREARIREHAGPGALWRHPPEAAH